jgi:hypothetical protein
MQYKLYIKGAITYKSNCFFFKVKNKGILKNKVIKFLKKVYIATCLRFY